MTRVTWHDLSPRTRKILIVGATVEAVLKLAALVDLTRRPAAEVRGSKLGWAVAIVIVNCAGAVPLAYFRRGRKPE